MTDCFAARFVSIERVPGKWGAAVFKQIALTSHLSKGTFSVTGIQLKNFGREIQNRHAYGGLLSNYRGGANGKHRLGELLICGKC